MGTKLLWPKVRYNPDIYLKELQLSQPVYRPRFQPMNSRKNNFTVITAWTRLFGNSEASRVKALTVCTKRFE